MSVHIDINIADGAARRHLEINRLNPEQMKMDGPHRSRDDVANYEVIITGGRGPYPSRATFYHRYGDSEMHLFGEAVQALIGRIPERSVPKPEPEPEAEETLEGTIGAKLAVAHQKFDDEISGKAASRRLVDALLADLDALEVTS